MAGRRPELTTPNPRSLSKGPEQSGPFFWRTTIAAWSRAARCFRWSWAPRRFVPALLWLSPALFGRQAPSFRDQGDFFFPLKLYTADRIARGQLPLWNPLSGLGRAVARQRTVRRFLSAHSASSFFLPRRSPEDSSSCCTFAIGISGAWRFLKNEAVSDPGALLGAAAYGACGFAASLSAYWNHFGAWAYLPWIASLARSGLRSRDLQDCPGGRGRAAGAGGQPGDLRGDALRRGALRLGIAAGAPTRDGSSLRAASGSCVWPGPRASDWRSRE